jgi:hypothetical protein
MRTEKGRVVYNRKVHLFDFRDVFRVLKSIKGRTTLEEFIKRTIESLQESIRIFEEDYVEAFKYSLEAAWHWVATGEVMETFSESRVLFTKPPTIEDLYAPPPDEKLVVLAGFVAEMLNTIEEIEKYIETEDL